MPALDVSGQKNKIKTTTTISQGAANNKQQQSTYMHD